MTHNTNFGRLLMQIAKSLVMNPASIVSMQTASKASEKKRSSVLLSNLARCSRPRVHAKMEAEANKSYKFKTHFGLRSESMLHSYKLHLPNIKFSGTHVACC